VKTIRATTMALCAILLLGTFASAQYRDRDEDRRGGGGGDLYRSAHADVDEARKMLLMAGRGDPDLRQVADDVSAVGSELGGAEQELNQGRGVRLPVDPVRGRDPYERALNLLDRALRKISAANGRTRNPDALAHGDNAQKRLETVLQTLQSGDRRGGRGGWR
jgi:hypothetical protein